MQTGITTEWQKGIKDLEIRVHKEEKKIACAAKWVLQILSDFLETTAVKNID